MSQPYTPWDYQKQAIAFLIKQACAGLFLDPGLGKTSIVYAAFSLLKRVQAVDKMLVIAPLRPAQSTWPKEQQKWADFNHLRVAVLHGPDKDKLLDGDYDVYVINPEGLGWLFEAIGKKSWFWDMLVVDESTRFKHSNTVRFKTLKSWLDKFGRRYILTGSPAPNGLLDLFGQMYLLDLGRSLGRFITHYRTMYFDQTGYGGYTYVLREGSAEKIYERIRPLVLRLAAKDLLELPELVYNVVRVDLPPDARKQYDNMEDLLLTSIKDEVVTAANAAAATGKCRQIANGGLYGENNGARTIHHIHEAKLDAVEELVEELNGKPALIAYEFDHDRIRLQRRFPNAPYIGGGVAKSEFTRIENLWNAGALPVLLAQPQSVAHGLNLQETEATVIFHSLTWDLENDEQFIRRVWRQGQKGRVVVHRVVATKTVDEVILRMLSKKDRTQQDLLGALRDYLVR